MNITETIISQYGHHGEVQFYKASDIADGFEKSTKRMLAKGSKGGNHSLTGDYEFFASERYPNRFYVRVNSPCVVHHHVGGDINLDIPSTANPKSHANGTLLPGLYFVTKQFKKDIVNDVMVPNND